MPSAAVSEQCGYRVRDQIVSSAGVLRSQPFLGRAPTLKIAPLVGLGCCSCSNLKETRCVLPLLQAHGERRLINNGAR